MTKQELFEEIDTFLTNFDVTYNGEDYDTIEAIVSERILEMDIIYYRRAMEYLLERDPSLRTSLELANDMGYSPADLNSEMLATILYQDEKMQEWYAISDDVEKLIYEYENAEDDDE